MAKTIVPRPPLNSLQAERDTQIETPTAPTAEPSIEIQPLKAIPFIRTRLARGPRSKKDKGFLMATYKPRPSEELPEEFSLQVRDNAMAPDLTPGGVAVFSRVRQPVEGDVVLFGSEFGPDIRRFERAADGRIIGRAINTDEWEDIDSADEQVWVIAVLIGTVLSCSQPPDDTSAQVA